MIVPPPIFYEEENSICIKDCELCDKNKDCEFKEAKRYIDILNKNIPEYGV